LTFPLQLQKSSLHTSISNLRIYQTLVLLLIILEIIGFVNFKHFKLQQNHSQYAYSIYISFKISFILLIGNNPFTKQSNFQLVTMSNLLISLSILILIQIITMFGSIPFFLQNSKGCHSWLFYLNNSIKTLNLPNCFLQLWGLL